MFFFDPALQKIRIRKNFQIDLATILKTAVYIRNAVETSIETHSQFVKLKEQESVVSRTRNNDEVIKYAYRSVQCSFYLISHSLQSRTHKNINLFFQIICADVVLVFN